MRLRTKEHLQNNSEGYLEVKLPAYSNSAVSIQIDSTENFLLHPRLRGDSGNDAYTCSSTD